MNQQNKSTYESPQVEIVELKSEGMICASGGNVTPNNPFGGTEEIW